MATLTLRPNGAGNQNQWDAEGGDYTRVDEASSDGDSTRLYTPTDNRVSTFALENHASESGTINSVTVYINTRGLDPVSNSVQLALRTSSTDYFSSTKTYNNTSYHLESNAWTTNPNTSAAWTWSEIDALEAGMKRIGGGGQAVTQVYIEVDYSADSNVTVEPAVVSLVSSLVEPTVTAVDSTAYDNGYHYRRRITIDDTKVAGSSDFTDFPFLFTATNNDFKSEANGGKVENGTHLDIRFETTGGTQLKHEIDKYDATTGKVEAWVKIPTLGATADTEIYIYYGKVISATEQDPPNVWNSNYKAVWHLNDLLDSTSNNNDLTNTGGATTATGKIGGAYSFDETDDQLFITDANQTGLDIAGAFTIQAWVKRAASTSGENGILGKRFYSLITDDSHSDQLRLEVNLATSGFTPIWSTTAVADSTWTKVHGVYDLTNAAPGINGASENPSAKSEAVLTNGEAFQIGAHFGAVNYWGGEIDECRVLSVALSDNWLTTEYNNESDPATFFSLASEEVPGTTVPVTEVTATFSIIAPTVITDQVLTDTVQAATFNIQAPSLVNDQILTDTVQTATFSIQEPTVVLNTDTTISADLLEGSFSIQSPSFVNDQILTDTVQTATFNIQAPTVVAEGGVVTAATEISATLSVQEPSVLTNQVLSQTVVSAAFTLQTPTIVIDGAGTAELRCSDIPLVSGSSYRLSLLLRSTVDQTATVKMQNSALSGESFSDTIYLPANTWKLFKKEFTAAATDDDSKLRIFLELNENHDFYADRVRLFNLTFERKQYRVMRIQGSMTPGSFVQTLTLREVTATEV